MKFLPTNLGAQPKQLAILGGLLVTAGVVYWINKTPEAQGSVTPAPAAREVADPVPLNTARARNIPALASAPPRTPQRSSGTREVGDFRPTLKLKEGTDVSKIDPTLRLDVLAKLRTLEMEGGSRSIFDFFTPPPPAPPKIVPAKVTVAAPPPPPPTPVDPQAKPPAPPPTPIPLKFYGYANTPRSGPRRAFFLDGEDIFVAGENDLIRNRYKIIRIGVNSAVVEDTTNKNQQTLPLVEELAG